MEETSSTTFWEPWCSLCGGEHIEEECYLIIGYTPPTIEVEEEILLPEAVSLLNSLEALKQQILRTFPPLPPCKTEEVIIEELLDPSNEPEQCESSEREGVHFDYSEEVHISLPISTNLDKIPQNAKVIRELVSAPQTKELPCVILNHEQSTKLTPEMKESEDLQTQPGPCYNSTGRVDACNLSESDWHIYHEFDPGNKAYPSDAYSTDNEEPLDEELEEFLDLLLLYANEQVLSPHQPMFDESLKLFPDISLVTSSTNREEPVPLITLDSILSHDNVHLSCEKYSLQESLIRVLENDKFGRMLVPSINQGSWFMIMHCRSKERESYLKKHAKKTRRLVQMPYKEQYYRRDDVLNYLSCIRFGPGNFKWWWRDKLVE